MARFSGRLTALAFAAMLAVVPAILVVAQSDETSSTGANVLVTASGGDVRAAGAYVTVAGTAANIKAAGAEVKVTAEAAGSVYAAGGRVVLSGPVAAAVKVFGANVLLTGKVGGDAEVAGAVIDVNSAVGGNLRAGGATVAIGKDANLAGELMAGGANVVFDGHVAGPARLGGASVTFNGVAGGSVSLAGASVVIGPDARIAGDLLVRSPSAPVVTAGAVITGKTTHVRPVDFTPPAWMWIAGLSVMVVLGTILAGLVLILFGGRVFAISADHARHRPMSSFLIGLLVVILIPMIAIVLMATLVGFSVGVAILFLLPALFVFGHAIAATGIAGGLFIRHGGPIGLGRAVLMLVAGAIIVTLIGLIPWVGMWAVCIVLVLGVGALARTVGNKLRAVFVPVSAAA
ncbi:hypothetical protein BH10PSE9_BH10PSE9_18460 [soil metagenome]